MSKRRAQIDRLARKADRLLTDMVTREHSGGGRAVLDTTNMRRLTEMRENIMALERGEALKYPDPEEPSVKLARDAKNIEMQDMSGSRARRSKAYEAQLRATEERVALIERNQKLAWDSLQSMRGAQGVYTSDPLPPITERLQYQVDPVEPAKMKQVRALLDEAVGLEEDELVELLHKIEQRQTTVDGVSIRAETEMGWVPSVRDNIRAKGIDRSGQDDDDLDLERSHETELETDKRLFRKAYDRTKAVYEEKFPGEKFSSFDDKWKEHRRLHDEHLFKDLDETELEEEVEPVEAEPVEEKTFRVDDLEGDPLLRLQGKGGVRPLRSRYDSAEAMRGGVTRLGPEQEEALVRGFSGAEISAGTGGRMFVNFGKALAENAALAGAMVALGYALPPEANTYVNYAFDAYAIAELMNGNPAMAAITGGMELWKEFGVQGARMKYNVQSDRDHGKKFGYVRDGDRWYPAFVVQHEKWSGGLGERGNDMDLVYGRNLVFRILPNGKIEPEFLHPIGKRHVMASDDDLKATSKDIAEKDAMRDWYLLKPEDLEVLTTHGQQVVKPKSPMTPYKDDWDRYKVPSFKKGQPAYLPEWWSANLDLRRSLDYIKHWSIGKDARVVLPEPAAPGLLQLRDSHAILAKATPVPFSVVLGFPGDEDYKIGDHWSGAYEGKTNKDYLLKTLLSQSIVRLQKAQFQAARESGYAKSTIIDVVGGPREPTGWKQATAQPWRNYVDFEKDLPEADSSDELRDQLLKIDGYKDRTAMQRAYLGNKAIVRYLLDVVEDRGGSDDLVKFLTENTDDTEMKHTINSAKDTEANYEPQGAWASSFKYGQQDAKLGRVANRYLNYVTPWSNKGESFLPSGMQPKDRRLLLRTQDIEQQQQRSIKTDESSWSHGTGAGTKPSKSDAWSVNIHGAGPGKPDKDVTTSLQEWHPGMPLPKHEPPQPPEDKTLGVKFGKQAKVRFAEPRTLLQIRAWFKEHGARGLSKSELKQFRDFQAKQDKAKPHGRKTALQQMWDDMKAEKEKGRGPGGDTLDSKDWWFSERPLDYRWTGKEWVKRTPEEKERLQYQQRLKDVVGMIPPKQKKGAPPKEFIFYRLKKGAHTLQQVIAEFSVRGVKNLNSTEIKMHREWELKKAARKGIVSRHDTTGRLDRMLSKIDTSPKKPGPKPPLSPKVVPPRPHLDDLLGGGGEPQKKHHTEVHRVPVVPKIEHQPSWVHDQKLVKHVSGAPYTFTPYTYNEEAFARFEGRHYEGSHLSKQQQAQPQVLTSHQSVEIPPHVDMSTEAPPPQALVPPLKVGSI